MKISRKVDYALRAIIFLANQPRSEIYLISDISTATGVSKSFMAKILKELSIRGFVKGQKGAHGGYRLCASPEQISFKDVIEAIDGPIEINECIPNSTLCARNGSCEMYHIWNQAYKAMSDIFEQTKISDLNCQHKSLVNEKI